MEAEDAQALTDLTVTAIEDAGGRPFASRACIPVATGSDGASVMLGKHAGWNERLSAKVVALLQKEKEAESGAQ